MIIVQQIVGTGLTNFIVDEATYASQIGAGFSSNQFKYDGADWNIVTPGESGVVDLNDYGISFTGTPVTDDEFSVAQFYMENLWDFYAGKGINCNKINENFAEVQNQSNTNETEINNIASTALLKDGSNLTQSAIDTFQQQTPNILSTDGTISLTDNTANFLTLTGNGTISLPAVAPDQYSHTISLVVAGGSYSLDLGTTYHLYNNLDIDTTQTYNVLYVYNKLDNHWYYSLTQ
jgi:hypothetical protein